MNGLNEKNTPARWKAMAEMLIKDPERFAKLHPEHQKLLQSIIDGTQAVTDKIVKQVEKLAKEPSVKKVKGAIEEIKTKIEEKVEEVVEKVEEKIEDMTKTE